MNKGKKTIATILMYIAIGASAASIVCLALSVISVTGSVILLGSGLLCFAVSAVMQHMKS